MNTIFSTLEKSHNLPNGTFVFVLFLLAWLLLIPHVCTLLQLTPK